MALTPQGTQRIEIIVRKSTDGGLTGAKEKSADEEVKEPSQENQEESKGTKSIKTKAFWRTQLTHSAAVAKQLGTMWLQYNIASLAASTGDQSLQNRINRDVEVISDTTNIATSVAMGATYGSMGGPLGMVLGATMMGAQTTATTLFKYRTRERDYDINMYKQNNAIEYKRARAQINLTTGRLR